MDLEQYLLLESGKHYKQIVWNIILNITLKFMVRSIDFLCIGEKEYVLWINQEYSIHIVFETSWLGDIIIRFTCRNKAYGFNVIILLVTIYTHQLRIEAWVIFDSWRPTQIWLKNGNIGEHRTLMKTVLKM